MAVRPPSRFDYLFEPIDDDEADVAVGTAVAASTVPVAQHQPGRRPLTPLAVAMLFGAGIGAAVLWPDAVAAVQTPTVAITPVSSTATPVSLGSTAPSAPPPEVPPAPSEVATSNAMSVPATAPGRTAETVAPTPDDSPSRTAARSVPTPIVRLPMSVSPEPRSSPPGHAPGDGGRGRGGLLGGGLPGPL